MSGEAMLETSCFTACQSVCVTVCQHACLTTCQHPCTTACQTQCITTCQNYWSSTVPSPMAIAYRCGSCAQYGDDLSRQAQTDERVIRIGSR